MKKIISILLLFLMPQIVNAGFAEEIVGEAFMSCSSLNNGSYLDFYKDLFESNIYIEVSGQSQDVDWPIYKVTLLQLMGMDIEGLEYGKTLIDVSEAMNSEETHFGDVFVKANSEQESQLYLNLNNEQGQNYLVIDGRVEPIICQEY